MFLHCLLLLTLITHINAIVIVHNITYLTATTPLFNAELHRFHVDDFRLTAKLVVHDPSASPDLYLDAIVMFEYGFGIDSFARDVQMFGAVGIIMKMPTLAWGGTLLDKPRRAYSFPCLEMAFDDYDMLVGVVRDSTDDVYAFIRNDVVDEAFFQQFVVLSLAWNVFFGIYFMAIFFITLSLFAYDIREKGVHFNVKFVIGAIIVLLNFYRLWYSAVDPITGYRVISWRMLTFLSFLHVAVSLITSIIVTTFWFEETGKRLHTKEIKCLMKTKIPLYIVIVLSLVVCIFLGVLTFLEDGGILLYDSLPLALLILNGFVLILSIFLLVVAFVIYKQIKRFEKAAKRKNNSLRFISLVCTIALLDFAEVLAFLGFALTYDIYLTNISAAIYFFLGGLKSLVVMALFKWGNTQKESTTSHI